MNTATSNSTTANSTISNSATSSADVLTVRRLLPAPRDRVFAAWLDPKSLVQFMAARPGWSATAEVDPQVGGKFRIVMHTGNGEHPHTGEYLIIDRPSRLSFTWISTSTEMMHSVVVIDFLDHPAGTDLVLTHRKLPVTAIEAHRNGWTTITAKLESVL